MDKLTGVIEMEEHSIPFFMNDFVFDFTTIDMIRASKGSIKS